MKHISVFRWRQKMCDCYNGCSSWNRVRTYYKDWKSGTQNSTGTFSFSPDLFNNLHMKAINCYDAARPNQKVMPSDLVRKPRLKHGDIDYSKGRLDSCTMERQMKQTYWQICIILQQKVASVALKPAIIQLTAWETSYSISRCTWKWTTNILSECLQFNKCLHFT
jgi:hypothetical protein